MTDDTVNLDEDARAAWGRVNRAQFAAIGDPQETVRHHVASGEGGALETLPTLTLRTLGAQPRLFEIGLTRLGVGGMGEVRLGRQPALQRDVAIKLVRSGVETGDDLTRTLLREALVMGYLEHPNIVPIHVVGRDEQGEIVVAMKRVEGQTLQDRLTGVRPVDELDADLEAVVQVCNALEFAHRRGVVHLDIKPANVMIGAFGEVYLLDWGTAVAYRDDVPPAIPRLLADGLIRGTPAYLAPEMVTSYNVGPAADIYMLGGLLYAIVTGRGPNFGATPQDVLKCAYFCPPRALPDGVPAELAAIIHRALAREPSARFASAAELRDCLNVYLRSKAARQIVELAQLARGHFETLVATDADAFDVYSAFGAARRLVSDAERVAGPQVTRDHDLRALIVRMCAWELDHGKPAAAQALLHELASPDPALAARVAAALEAEARERAELQDLRRQIDPRVANRHKVVMWLLIGGAIGLIYVTPAVLGFRPTATDALVGHVGYLIALLGVTVAMRDRLMETRTNREVLGLVWVLSLFGLVLRIGAHAGGLDLGLAIAFDLALVGGVAAFAGWTIDRRVAVAVPFEFAGAAAAWAWPEQASLVFGITHAVGLSAVAAAHVRATSHEQPPA